MPVSLMHSVLIKKQRNEPSESLNYHYRVKMYHDQKSTKLVPCVADNEHYIAIQLSLCWRQYQLNHGWLLFFLHKNPFSKTIQAVIFDVTHIIFEILERWNVGVSFLRINKEANYIRAELEPWNFAYDDPFLVKPYLADVLHTKSYNRSLFTWSRVVLHTHFVIFI